jgi:choline-sulfatase
MSTESPPPEDAPRLTRIGEASALALVVAVLAALPTAIRARADAGLLDGMLVGAAMCLCIALPIALLARRAARGFRGVVGRAPSRGLGFGLAMWAGASTGLLLALATILKVTTNHRGLGGATFGVFGAGVVVATAVLVARLMAIGERLAERGVPHIALVASGGLLIALPLVALVIPMVGEAAGATTMRAALFDTLLLIAAGGLVLGRRLPPAMLPLTRVAALPIAACIVVVGLVRVETSQVGASIQRAGGLPAALLAGLEQWTDHDGDGIGAHFGGRDCDEGDPSRHPGAEDAAGDGRDTDCDGSDGAATLAMVTADPAHATTKPNVAAEPSATTQAGSAAPAVAAAPVDTGSQTVAASAPPTATSEPTAEPTSKPAAAPSDGTTPDSTKPDSTKPDSTKPDIILVTLDSVRADRCSLYGYGTATTPSLDALAKRAVVFEHAYAAGTTTQRALMPLFTGASFADTPHTEKEWPRIRDEATSLAERLSQAGYATAAVTSFTWLRKDRGFGQGFGVFDESAWSKRHPEREYTSDLAIKAAIAHHTDLAKDDAPLFLWVHLFDPHSKFVAHAEHDFGESLSKRYDGEIAFTDAQLGRLIEAVQAGPRADRTTWIVHGSHGEAFGEHDKMGHDRVIFDEVLRVPLLIAAPSTEARRYDEGAVSIFDVAPTITELAGLGAKGIAGSSLAPVLRGGNAERGPVIAHAHSRLAIIDWPLKLHVRRRKDKRDRLILFDLAADPAETKDLSPDRTADLKRLHAFAKP